MRSLSVKQAEKWLDRMKQLDPAAYREVSKCLKRFDQTNDELDCFMKMNQALYSLPALATQLNNYMEDGNKFIVNNIHQRLNLFLELVRNTKFQLYNEILEYIDKLKKQNNLKQMTNVEATQMIKAGLLNIVKGVPSLVSEVEKIIPIQPEEASKSLDLKHLKNKVITFQKDEQDPSKVAYIKKAKKPQISEMQHQKPKQAYRQKNLIAPAFFNIGEQKSFLKQIQKKVGPFHYDQIIKILELYQKNIITRSQFIKLVQPILEDQVLGLKDIINSREIDRRKSSLFKPLSDIDFHILPRETHSYVQIPRSYPHYAANRTSQHLQILNNKWVSVPRGSQVIFNVRIKNLYELALNKCEDERYQFDLVIKKYRKILEIFQSIIQQLKADQKANVNYLLKTAVSLGIIQLIYKNASKQNKETFQQALNKNTLNTVKCFHQRISKNLEQLQQCRKIYAIKIWSDVANKNFYKSLDFKNHDFKNNQKFRMKPQSFIDQLNNNVRFLQSRGTKRINDNPFDQKTEFFSILNSFQTSSKKERCFERKLPTPRVYDLAQYRFPALLPAIIMAFQDKQAFSKVCTFVFYYFDYNVTNQTQRNRCKRTFKQIINKILRIKQVRNGGLTHNFDEEQFYTKLASKQIFNVNTSNWIFKETQMCQKDQSTIQQVLNLNSMIDQTSQYSFEPPRSQNNIVFYASQSFYVFLRFLYSLYERVIKMSEIVKNQKKLQVFDILYYANIKTKESIKFEESLNIIFGESGYLFSTFYKIVEAVCKSIVQISLSPFQNQSMELLSNKNEQVYLLLLNRSMFNLQSSPNKLVRILYEYDTSLLYITSFNPYYKFTQQSLKEHNKRRLQITKNVENFNQQPLPVSNFNKVQLPQTRVSSKQEYYFESMSSKLVNIACYQDIIIGNQRSPQINLNKQCNKLKKMRINYKI